MPDLKLSAQQAQRLWQLPVPACDEALTLLVERGFRTRSDSGEASCETSRRVKIGHNGRRHFWLHFVFGVHEVRRHP